MISLVLSIRQVKRFTEESFDRTEEAEKAARILKGILEGRSARLSEITRAIPRNPEANHKMIQRFLAGSDSKASLLHLFDAEAPFILGDVTEVPRRQAKRTEYVGWLRDGKTLGFLSLVLARAYQGWALPCHFLLYSERTLNEEGSSRNLEHWRVFRQVTEFFGREAVGVRPGV